MPSAAIPTVTPGIRLFTGSMAALHRLGRKLGNAWFKNPREQSGQQQPTRLQRDELMSMSTHELRDLGIGRSEIPALFGEPSSWNASRY
ncbi:DUF1127 domain-containing protein [Polaromonas aquatica]|jgi:uncharacterized protein YjiS (DUF1127 family)|uniref:DUF1127 domain-containing protein n=1 Tax=Polaromonas aquatica TaxID=332657 RepID=UPI003D64EC35